MSIKVYIHYDNGVAPAKTSKIEIPKSWMTKTVADIIGLFTKAYNSKNPEHAIVIESVHLQTADGVKIYSDAIVDVTLGDHSDYHIKNGVHIQRDVSVKGADSSLSGKLRCKNYGCGKYFDELENNDSACKYHCSPPIFHDTMKCWSCCKDKKAYDFESFQLIQGCTVGRHSTENAGALIGDSPNAPKINSDSGAGGGPVLKSIADYNSSNPKAATAVSSAVDTVFGTRKSTRAADGVTARCQRKGCQKNFNITDNNATACVYHCGQPVFHDAVKFWSCCADKKCYDFDEFLAVKGCSVGVHDDGVIDL